MAAMPLLPAEQAQVLLLLPSMSAMTSSVTGVATRAGTFCIRTLLLITQQLRLWKETTASVRLAQTPLAAQASTTMVATQQLAEALLVPVPLVLMSSVETALSPALFLVLARTWFLASMPRV